MTDVQLVVLGWGLGVLVGAVGGAGRLIWQWWKGRQMEVVIESFYSGTKLRNRGVRIRREAESAESDWMRDWEKWKEEMGAAARKYNKARTANVEVLVDVPLQLERFKESSGPMIHSLSQLSETLLRLSVFISR